jgi:hypothetical protein
MYFIHTPFEPTSTKQTITPFPAPRRALRLILSDSTQKLQVNNDNNQTLFTPWH